jgi:hypothetical protein
MMPSGAPILVFTIVRAVDETANDAQRFTEDQRR